MLMKKKSKLFYKYLFSYMTIFLIPFIITSVILYYMSVTDLREEIILSNTEKLEQVKDLVDERQKELQNIANRISYDPRLTPYMFKQPYESIEAIRELNTYKMNSSFIEELYLYYHDDGQLHSTGGSGSIDTFAREVYHLTEQEKENLVNDLKSAKVPINRSISIKNRNKKELNAITYAYPIPVNSASYGTLLFIVKEKTFTNLIKDMLGEFEGSIYIFNEKGEKIASSTNGKSLDSKDFLDFSKGRPGIEEKELQDKQYSLVRIRSDKSNWTFVSAVPTGQFYSKMGALKKSIIIMLSLIILLGASIAILFTFKQYKPIYKITEKLRAKHIQPDSDVQVENELENIIETIEYMYNDNEILLNKMRVQKPFARDQLLLKLLNGDTRNVTGNTFVLNDLDMALDGHYFTVVIAFNDKINKKRTLIAREALLRWLSEFSFENGKGYGVELVYDNAIALIVNISADKEQEYKLVKKSFVNELIHRLQKTCSPSPRIGVGRVYEGVERINHSYIEASASLNYNLLNTSVYFEEFIKEEKSPSNFWYPMDQQVRFTQSLKQGDLVVAQDTLSNIFKGIRSENSSVYLLRCMCFDVVNTVLKSISELGLNKNVTNIKELVEFHSLNELEIRIKELLSLICEEINKRKESQNNTLRDNILDYISSHYKSHELSLESTAENFNLSVSYLSRFIKDQTGTTFTQYVWDLRNKEFKRQLIVTTCPIKEIVLDIGYIDVANFTRKFKKEEGLTPGQYRRQYSNNESLKKLHFPNR